jgi:hypothetical protein
LVVSIGRLLGSFLLLLRGFDQSQFGRHREIGHRAVDDQFIQPILKKVLFDGYVILKIGEAHL